MPQILLLLEKLCNRHIRILVNRSEAAANGAAVHATILNGGVLSNLVLVDLVSKSIKFERSGELLTLIPRNTQLPCVGYKIFTTMADN